MARAVIVAAVGATLVALWAVWSATAAPLPTLPAPTRAAGGDGDGGGAVAPGAERAGVAAAPAQAAAFGPGAVLAGGVREPAATDAPAPAGNGTETLAIVLLDGATRQPLPGVEALWSHDDYWHHLRDRSADERNEYRIDHERALRAFGQRQRSDEAGVVRVPAGRDGVRVIARHGPLYGEGWFGGEFETSAALHWLSLEPDAALRVRVLDAVGAPAAGVPLDLRARRANGAEAWLHPGVRATDAAGLTTFRHVQNLRHDGAGATFAAWEVHVLVPGLGLAPTAIPDAIPPSEPVAIRLPPTGSLRLRATLAGRPAPGFRELLLRDPASGLCWTRELEPDGWVEFPHLPLGVRFGVDHPGGGDRWTLTVDGPTRLGERVVRELRLEGGRLLAVARTVDAHGAPLRRARVAVAFRTAVGAHREPEASRGERVYVPLRAHASAHETFHTDDDGRFAFGIGGEVAPGEVVRLTHLELTVSIDGRATARCRVVERELTAGVNDLGDVTVAPQALVCSGRIVLAGGDPDDVAVVVERRVGGEWEEAHTVVDRAPGGVFVVRGELPAGPLRLGVTGEHVPVPPREFPAGATGLEIVLQRGAVLEATCLLPANAATDQLCVRLVGPGAAGLYVDPAFAPWEGPLCAECVRSDERSGVYRWRAVPAGTWTLVVQLRGIPAPVRELVDVVVPPPTGGDSRLAAIDLTADVAMLTLEVRDASIGERPRGGVLVLPQPQPDGAPWQGFDERGRYLVPARGVDLLVAAWDRRPVRLRAVPPLAAVELVRWPEVEATVAGGDLGDHGDGVGVVFRVAPVDPATERRYFAGSKVRALAPLLQPPPQDHRVGDGRVTLVLGDGPHRLRAFVALGARRRELQHVIPAEVVAGAPVTVHLQPAEVHAAVASLRAEPQPAERR